MIRIENLVKSFGPKRAVDGVSFNVERGEVLGFLGPNGAGKSTTMRMITGFIPPTEGKVAVGGYDVTESPLEAKRLIGYLPEAAPSYPDMTVHGFLAFAADMRGLTRRGEEQGDRPRGRAVLPVLGAAPGHRHAVQGLQAPHLPRAGADPRPGGAGARRADRRPRPEPEARGAQPDPRARPQQGGRVLDPHPGGSRRRVLRARSSSTAAGSSPTARRRSCAACPTWPGAVTVSGAGRERRQAGAARPGRAGRRRLPRVPRRQGRGRASWRAKSPRSPRAKAGGSRRCAPKKASSTRCSAASRCPTR